MNITREVSVLPAQICSIAHGLPDARYADQLAIEAPLEVRIVGNTSTILMRTPGHDEELVHGFLFNEGFIHAASDIVALTRPVPEDQPEHENVLGVELRSSAKISLDRDFMSNSSCGACGKRSIAAIRVQAPVNTAPLQIDRTTLFRLPDELRKAQALFRITGGVHASGLFTPTGELVILREDVGRHNALDKLIGWASVHGRLPLFGNVLLLSGRVSFELVQKAIVSGIPIIAAVGAPSSLAVELAERYGITLVGFLRNEAMNVYAHQQRIRD